ncbi:twin-arginine translocase TatA/TatE family subunit [Methanonatronarchaeum sp. AMET6-2]|uniref:twin-arginine translocase TatA/TatE family subunit n=1 Tax=Methanonatronarchaeum sp. AMET6-2 TaxID=2933293 RepID=UPI0011FDD60E|nr:twin-arginine translocase TatA/TatE family subunit [Methanonatronarchaeum sp. AMET6-2]RZN63226.1 MAG: twin-arginine translocase TatA/TatE family subunit [Methanonatronarchaeia archaeon]UOY10514.1 twin-arginine translocase TatA/TatE family subunit [Methanonatronarchaeum sp. AMET6-2]
MELSILAGGPLGIGLTEWVLIFLVILLLFGASKLPKLARSMGTAMGEFKKARNEMEQEVKQAEYETLETEKEEDEEKDDLSMKNIAKDLGIDVEGKTEEEIKKKIQEAMKEKGK